MSGFIDRLAPFAIKHGRPAGVLPSLIIAQGILESALGTSELAVKANNLFGIKAGSGWDGPVYLKNTGEYTNNKYHTVMADFRSYPDYEGCVVDLVHKYTHGTGWEKHNRYAAVLGEKDYKQAACAVHAAGYATDPKYADKLIKTIEGYGLTKYDKEMVNVVKIALDAGHGMNTPGKRTPDGEREWSFNNKVLLAAWRKLEKIPGVQLKRTDDRTGRTDISLSSRVSQANSWRADVFVSFHHNALSGKWHNGGGTEVYTSHGSSARSNQLAKSVAPKIARAMGLGNRGHKRANFYVIHNTTMPAILVEGGFMDSNVDIKALRSDAKLKAQGEAVADAIIEVFGLKVPSGPVHASKPSSSVSGIDYGAYLYGQPLNYGMGGAAVKRFQGDMTKLGYKLTQDGSYGPASRDAVKRFQKDNKLEVDGIAGPATQAMIRKKLAELNKPKPAASKDPIYRVIVDGKQVGAYRDGDNILEQAKKAIAAGKKDVKIEKV